VRTCHAGACICAHVARDTMWQHGDQWPSMMAIHVHAWACGKRWPCLHLFLVTTCPCIVHVMVLCARMYSRYMHVLSCRRVCSHIHGSWIHVPLIISAFILGRTMGKSSFMYAYGYAKGDAPKSTGSLGIAQDIGRSSGGETRMGDAEMDGLGWMWN